MPRRGYEKEGQLQNMILDVIPYDEPGVTWTEISRKLKDVGLGTEALSKYLKRLVSLRMVLHNQRFYRRNPVYRERWDIFNRAIANDLPERSQTIDDLFYENFRSQPLRAVYDWTTIGFPFGETKTDRDVIERTKTTLVYVLLQYLAMLQELVDIKNKVTAREFVSLFNKVKIQPLFISLAHSVWENRGKVRLKGLNLSAELESFAQYGVRPPSNKPDATSSKPGTIRVGRNQGRENMS